jgi:hypothetical protein
MSLVQLHSSLPKIIHIDYDNSNLIGFVLVIVEIRYLYSKKKGA